MSLQRLIDELPDYARDQKQNLATLAGEAVLSDQQKWGCFLAAAYAIGEPRVIALLEQETDPRLKIDTLIAVKSAAAIMAMNTVYYRAINLIQNHEYRTAPVGLAMSALTSTSVDKIDFELWALAVSAVNGCGSCLNTHEIELRKRSVSLARIQTALRIAAVVNAVSAIVRAEGASAPLATH